MSNRSLADQLADGSRRLDEVGLVTGIVLRALQSIDLGNWAEGEENSLNFYSDERTVVWTLDYARTKKKGISFRIVCWAGCVGGSSSTLAYIAGPDGEAKQPAERALEARENLNVFVEGIFERFPACRTILEPILKAGRC